MATIINGKVLDDGTDPQPEELEDMDDYEDDGQRTCLRCNGTGGEPMDDGITPCENCDGEGYEYWR